MLCRPLRRKMNAQIYASGNIGVIKAGLARDTETHKLTPRIGPKHKKFGMDAPTSKAKHISKAATTRQRQPPSKA
jgi:hypothetical protein